MLCRAGRGAGSGTEHLKADMDQRTADPFTLLMESLRSLAPKIVDALEWVGRNQEVVTNVIWQFLEGGHLDGTGWLPHPILAPLNIGLVAHPNLREVVEKHYRDNWPRLRAEFATDIGAFDVDEQAKDVFADAIELHEAGHYRAVCRLIFPELERLVRQELMNDPFATATSLKELRRRLARLPLASHLNDPRSRALSLFTALESHFFQKVVTEEALAMFQASGIPNRHACVHGLIDYNSFQNSLNMLILADYCYSAIGRVRSVGD